MGRPLSLTPDKHRTIANAIRGGVPKQTAVMAARIDIATYKRWMAKGKTIFNSRKKELTPDEELLRAFYVDVRDAERQCEAWLVSKLTKAIEDGDIGTAKWMLERRFPRDFVLRTHIGVSGSAQEDEPVEVEFVLAIPKIQQAPADSFGTENDVTNDPT